MVTAEAFRSYSFLVSVCLCSEPVSDASMEGHGGRSHTPTTVWAIIRSNNASTPLRSRRGRWPPALSRKHYQVFDVGVGGEFLLFPIVATNRLRQSRCSRFEWPISL